MKPKAGVTPPRTVTVANSESLHDEEAWTAGRRDRNAIGPVGQLYSVLSSPELEPVFWPPSRTGAESAWWGHVPFAHWLVPTLRPGVLVELGTHHGVSFLAFCEAMQRGGIVGRCYAVDTWMGDPQAGFYGEEVFNQLAPFTRARYGDFAELLRQTFDDALTSFEDGSVDLLHIDGLHTYEAVAGDFEKWRPKLSRAGVVLLHDTNVRRADFGVWKLWADLRERYPTFEFLHDYGLGIVAVGADVPKAVAELCELGPRQAATLRDRFAQLGERWVAADQSQRAQREWHGLVAQHTQQTGDLRAQIERLQSQFNESAAASSLHEQRVTELEQERARLALLGSEQQRRITELDAERERSAVQASELWQRFARLEAERERLAQLSSQQEQRIAELEAERDRRTSLLADRGQRIAALARRSKEIEADRKQLTLVSSEQRQRIAELEAERERLVQRSSNLLRRIAESEAEAERSASLLSEQTRRIADLEAEREQMAELSATQFGHIARLETERAWDSDLPRGREENRHRPRRLAALVGALRRRDRNGASRAPDEAGLSDAAWPSVAALSDSDVIAASGLFDASTYEGRVEAEASGMSPVEHYLAHGEPAGLPPSRFFDPSYYRRRHPDVAAAGISPLLHYITSGQSEGRTPVPAAAGLSLPTDRLRHDRETIVIAVHEASRTGAPIIAWNLVTGLRDRYNVVVLLRRSGPLEAAFAAAATHVVTLPRSVAWDDAEAGALADRIVDAFAPRYVIANSVETRFIVPALERAGVPVIALVHEFASTVRPRGALHELFETATEIVFPAQIVADAALAEHRSLIARVYRVLPQGPCRPPTVELVAEELGAQAGAPSVFPPDVPGLPGRDGSVVVLGVGTITPRKGLEFFIAAAARVARIRTGRKIVFAWAGHCYDFDQAYRDALDDQIVRSGLEASVLFLGEFEDPAALFSRADIVFLSSRLDPLPNVGIEAAVNGIPVVCFDRASGIAQLLCGCEETRALVVPYLDAQAAADRIVELAENPDRHAAASAAIRAIAARDFDMARYVEAIDALGQAAARGSAHVTASRETIRASEVFDAEFYLGAPATARDAVRALGSYLHASRRVAPRGRPHTGLCVRRPMPGFHPLIYAAENPDYDEASGEDPLAHYARTGFPRGRWCHEVIRPGPQTRAVASELRVAIHGHFHYPEFVPNFLERLRLNRTRFDLILTTTSEDKAVRIAGLLSDLLVPRAEVITVPNRGRDIGPMLTMLGRAELSGYDVVGHLHGKRSPHVHTSIGERWRAFLWENLIGGKHPMMDVVLARFASEGDLGLVFPEDPHLNDWDDNRDIAERLAVRMGLTGGLPTHFDFPLGTMFWARPAALQRLVDLGLDWDDYPGEPLPIDGTVLHALERLLPLAAGDAGYRYATTYVPGVVR